MEEWTSSLSAQNEEMVIFFTPNPSSAVCQENDFLWAWPENGVLKLIHCQSLAKMNTDYKPRGSDIYCFWQNIKSKERKKDFFKCVRWFSLAIQLCIRQVFECEAMC